MMAGRSGSCPQQPSLITSRGNCDPAVTRRLPGQSRMKGFVFRNWSGARDLNPGPHGPEVWAVSSTETVFEGFKIDSRHSVSY
jgi:hypothetical protein